MVLLCNGSIIHLSFVIDPWLRSVHFSVQAGKWRAPAAAALARKGSGFGGSHRQAMVAIQPRGMLGGSIPSPLVTPTVTLDDPSSAIIARGLPQLCRSYNPLTSSAVLL